MWYKVKELKSQGFNISQISRDTGLDRGTVRKYLKQTETEFHKWISDSRNLPLKLAKYMPFVKTELQNYPDLSAAQIEDRLLEHFTDLPDFHSKTVFNFVNTVRLKYDIAKPKKKDSRIFEKLIETEYGQEAQVDFGETWMQTINNKKVKVYFFAMVLSRSRYKFIYLDNKPFTAKSAVYAHDLAFEYFQGTPKKIIYDQDKVFISNENLGDYILTSKFNTYCNSQKFKAIFCRKADPQSKGKVENVVKYVKQNFLRARKFVDNQQLNKDGIAWLERTGNVKIHSTTQKSPTAEWHIERDFLLDVKSKNHKKEEEFKTYKVRKDNTITYKSNFYSLPTGTYKNSETAVLLQEKGTELCIYCTEKEIITRHEISIERGKYIHKSDHKREKSKTSESLKNSVLELIGDNKTSRLFLELTEKDKPRYYRDNLQVIIKKMREYPQEIIDESVLFCIENKQFNGLVLVQVIENKNLEKEKEEQVKLPNESINNRTEISDNKKDMNVKTSNITNYEKIFKTCQN